MTAEEWKPIAGFPGYQVSDLGRVLSSKRGSVKELRGCVVGGYRRVVLAAPGVQLPRPIHALVAEAFIGPRPEGQEVRHLDGDPTNNTRANLAYGTRADNMQDRLAHGRNPEANKTACPHGHDYTPENTMRYGGARFCRTCHRRRQREYKIRRALRAANVRIPA